MRYEIEVIATKRAAIAISDLTNVFVEVLDKIVNVNSLSMRMTIWKTFRYP